MKPTRPLVAHNIAYLDQASRLLQGVSDEVFVETRPPVFNSSIGDHLRHILEHYQAFLEGAPHARIDYDGRLRDQRMASDRNEAMRVIDHLREGLAALPSSDAAVAVRLDGSAEDPDADPWSDSTIKRELQYLQAHTVHHYALIAFILRLQGSAPSDDFGVAPSTLRHRHASRSAD